MLFLLLRIEFSPRILAWVAVWYSYFSRQRQLVGGERCFFRLPSRKKTKSRERNQNQGDDRDGK